MTAGLRMEAGDEAASGRHVRAVLLAAAIALLAALAAPSSALAGPCDPPVHAIACENSKPGTPASVWDINGSGDESIQGYATPFSVEGGQAVQFKVDTDASDYRLEIYRLGWYNGDGARLITTLNRSGAQNQPDCLRNNTTGLVDCGNWAVSASWNVPADAVSGVYIARLVRTDTGLDNHVYFVVRDDDRQADVLYQTSDTTWQAYNQYGGASLYRGDPTWRTGRAFKVSYNRPFTSRGNDPSSFFMGGEYPMVRWLESNGYDVSYSSGIDTDRSPAELLEHKAFMSSGHDEYWSGNQRANVEAARDAGINLAFFSANNVFWKTRWENSIDGTNTPHKTLVTYKETHDNAKSDPSPTWTGTWRDPRFSPPSDGGRPENALVGNIFTVNSVRGDALRVPYRYSRLRFWRNTSVANLQPGQTASMVTGILGHEWNEDLDNGHRPAGLINMSASTYDVSSYIQDHGNSYGNGSATHKLTLYRAPSGALVFGSGTVQWSWGLDNRHDGAVPAPDTRVRQATANLLADMEVLPSTLRTGLTMPAPSTDTTAPTATITSPAAGGSVQSGSTVTIRGTAADEGGGMVAGVEVSTDGGATWHPANGTDTWTYTWSAGGVGAVTLMARATDDSVNMQEEPTASTVNVTCPCTLWGNGRTPATPSTTDRGPLELGVRVQPLVDGYITAIRFYKGPTNTGSHVASLWSNTGTLLARAPFTSETAGGWQEVELDEPIAVAANTTYVASYHAPAGGYSLERPFFASAFTNSPLRAPADAPLGGNGVYAYSESPTFPANSFGASNYFVDVSFSQTPPPDTKRPTVISTSPTDGGTGVDPRGVITAQFSEAVDAATVNTSTVVLRDPAGELVPASVSYDSERRSAVLQPTARLPYSTTYSATVLGGANGVKDRAGNTLSPGSKVWSFTTAGPPTCPCSLFDASAAPAIPSSGDGNALELGVRFRADEPGYITAVKFYKAPGGAGPITTNLWTDAGQLLSRVEINVGSAGGWEVANLPTPIAIQADTTYVASYFSPTGSFAVDRRTFLTTYGKPPLRAPADGVGNGVFRYGSSTGFPSQSFQGSNYWVDVRFETVIGADSTPPTVTTISPAAGATSVSLDAPVVATFSESVDPATVNGSTLTLRSSGGTAVPATVTYDAPTRTATLRPTGPLATTTVYTATVAGGQNGVRDTAGNPLSNDRVWNFDTTVARACPCTLWTGAATPLNPAVSDPNPVELGLKFRADEDGFITGVRFYKGSGNTGTHTGSLWSATGTLLARVTFTGESISGWQQMSFASPVPITANTTYVVSYHAPNGRFPVNLNYFGTPYTNAPLRTLANSDGGNGMYQYSAAPTFPVSTYAASNYWVDVVYTRAQ